MSLFERTERLLGKDALTALAQSHIAVFGIGGVGSYVVEALARCGVGALSLFDADQVSESNCNRQLIATADTIGKSKVAVARQRVAAIHPGAEVHAHAVFVTPDFISGLDFSKYHYVVDAVDTVTAKLALIEKAKSQHIPIISCMGTGNKLDPTRFEIADLFETSVCPLARVMRREAARRGLKDIRVVYSKEPPRKPLLSKEADGDPPASGRRQVPGSISFVPSAAGLVIAYAVVTDLIKNMVPIEQP